MFDRHQAEITLMQFRGHSLPVHQSMSVSWDFLPCPISSANFHDFIRLLAIGICHFLPVHYFGMAYFAGSKYNTGRPVIIFLRQLTTDTGYSLDDLLEAMNDRDECRNRVREIDAVA